jgi:hypothetical protein
MEPARQTVIVEGTGATAAQQAMPAMLVCSSKTQDDFAKH